MGVVSAVLIVLITIICTLGDTTFAFPSSVWLCVYSGLTRFCFQVLLSAFGLWQDVEWVSPIYLFNYHSITTSNETDVF